MVVVSSVALSVAALFLLRREGGPAAFKTPLYPATPIIYLGLSALLLFLLASNNPKAIPQTIDPVLSVKAIL